MISHFDDDSQDLITSAIWNDTDKSIVVLLDNHASIGQKITLTKGNKQNLSGNKMTRDIIATFNGVNWE